MSEEKKKYIPKTKEEVLAELKQIDRFDLLKVKVKGKQVTADSILISSFEEINSFIDEHKRAPSDKGNGPIEFKLYWRLVEIQLVPEKVKILRSFDRHGLLQDIPEDEEEYEIVADVEVFEEEEPNSKLGLEDKFNLLKTPGSSIFNLKNVKPKEEKVTTMPEEVARREKCKDFSRFEALFFKCQEEILNGDRGIVEFQGEQDVKAGDFFILNGVTCYVAEVGEREIKNNRNNARLRLIFENGLESNMYHRSLTAELYKSGRRILPQRIKEGELEIQDNELTGFIYVLSSKSEDPGIQSIPNLFKIGFSTTPVAERIKNAKSDPTYLMAEVKVVASYKVAGIKPIYFENLIHRLFGHVQVKIEITGQSGKIVIPKEWFSVPFDVIDEALGLIQTRQIVGYVYDSASRSLRKK